MPLDEHIRKKIEEAFKDYVCSVCGGQAERYIFKKYWCWDCCPNGHWKPKSGPVEIKRIRGK